MGGGVQVAAAFTKLYLGEGTLKAQCAILLLNT